MIDLTCSRPQGRPPAICYPPVIRSSVVFRWFVLLRGIFLMWCRCWIRWLVRVDVG